MKINILFLMLILVSVLVTAITTLRTVEDTIPDETGTVGTWHLNHSLSNITDANLTTYAKTHVNNTFAYINWTKADGSGILSKVQITYNTSSGSTGTNYTFSDYPKCWYNNTDKLILRLGSNFTQNISKKVINETVIPIINRTINETITLLNDTAVPLLGRNVIVNTLTVFNQSINATVTNESGFTWLNNTNLTLKNQNLTSVNATFLFNCSGSSNEVLGIGNYTIFTTDGKIFMTSNATFPDGLDICLNYSYKGIGYGEELGSNNYTLDLTAGTLKLADTRFNNTPVGVNYTFSTPIPLDNIRILNNSVRLFNRTVNITVTNESGLVWLNNSNLTLAKNNLVSINATFLFNCSGDSYEVLGLGNYTIFTTDGKIFMSSNATFPDGLDICINYSYLGDGFGTAVSSSNYSIDYLSGNISILDDGLNTTLGINYTFLNDSTEKNKRECWNGTLWVLLGTESDDDEIFDIRMLWSVLGDNWTIDYHRIEPDQYTTYTSATILFNITANLTRSAGNQTTVNVSLWTRRNNASGRFNLTINSTVLINASHVNVTVTFTDGDRVWWYWAFEDNQSRPIINTSIRILDIDTIYSIMSIGTGVNITMFGDNAGDAVFQGSITSDGNIIGNNLTLSTGTITSPLMNLTNEGNLSIPGNFTLGYKIVFANLEEIDNLVNGWLRITGGLNVTENIIGDNLTLIDGVITSPLMNISSTGELSVGAIIVARGITSANITLKNITPSGCNHQKNGLMIYNASDHKVWVCDATEWQALW